MHNCVLNGISTALSESSSICSDIREISETEVMNSIRCTFDDPFDSTEESWHHVSSLLNMSMWQINLLFVCYVYVVYLKEIKCQGLKDAYINRGKGVGYNGAKSTPNH